GGYILRRRLMVRENIEHRQAVFKPAPSRNLVAQHNLFAVVMRARIEKEGARFLAQHLSSRSTQHRLSGSAATSRRENTPACKTARYLLHIFLRVAPIDTKGMK